MRSQMQFYKHRTDEDKNEHIIYNFDPIAKDEEINIINQKFQAMLIEPSWVDPSTQISFLEGFKNDIFTGFAPNLILAGKIIMRPY